MTDVEIARNTKLEDIKKIAEKCNLTEEEFEQYGKYKAKINQRAFERLKNKENGKLILVTAMNPTPLGEGKTTISIAVADGAVFSRMSSSSSAIRPVASCCGVWPS